MILFIVAIVCLLGGDYAIAEDVYHIRHLSERELLRTYDRVLVDGYRYSDKFWKTASFDSAAGYWGDGASDGNQGIRAIGEMVLVCGTLVKYSGGLNTAEKEECLRKAKAAIRFACATHLTGTQKCPDG